MKEGRVVEQGTHEGLLADSNGIYYELVNAQRLVVASESKDGNADDDDAPDNAPPPEDLEVETKSEEEELQEPEWKPKGFVASVGFFLYEQRQLYYLYALVLTGAMMAAGESRPANYGVFC